MDIQQLNDAAIKGRYDVTKISAAAYPLVEDEYDMLDSGAAMGFGAGPLLVARPSFDRSQLKEARIVLPGRHTTAHYLFNHFYPDAAKKEFMVFSEIEDAVSSGRADAGVIIHEGRFTYPEKGLMLLADLGVLWDQTYALPLPLGIMVCRKHFPDHIKTAINDTIQASIQFAFDHPQSSEQFVLENAREMSPEVVKQHIQLYVNAYSLSMGPAGIQAINFLILQSKLSNNVA